MTSALRLLWSLSVAFTGPSRLTLWLEDRYYYPALLEDWRRGRALRRRGEAEA